MSSMNKPKFDPSQPFEAVDDVLQKDPNFKSDEDKKIAAERRKEQDKIEAEARKPTPSQELAANRARQMELAEENFQKLAKKGFDRTGTLNSFESGLLNLPYQVGDLASGLIKGTHLIDPDVISSNISERTFTAPELRAETGATARESETGDVHARYIPSAGEGPREIEQKRLQRLALIAAQKTAAGPAYENLLKEEEVQRKKNPQAPVDETKGLLDTPASELLPMAYSDNPKGIEVLPGLLQVGLQGKKGGMADLTLRQALFEIATSVLGGKAAKFAPAALRGVARKFGLLESPVAAKGIEKATGVTEEEIAQKIQDALRSNAREEFSRRIMLP